MAFTNNVTLNAMVTELQSVNANMATDACLSALYALAAGVQAPIGTSVIIGGILVKCTTGWGTPGNLTALVFSYDAAPS